MAYTPVAGVVSQLQVNDGPGSPAPLPNPITPNFASTMRMEIEGGVFSEGGKSDVQDADKSLDTTQDSSGLGNRTVVEDEDELPSHILNSTFDDRAKQETQPLPTSSECTETGAKCIRYRAGTRPDGILWPSPPQQQHMGQQGGPPLRPHLFGVIRMALSMPPHLNLNPLVQDSRSLRKSFFAIR